MSGWLDRWARSSASPAPGRPDWIAEVPPTGLSRRQLIKRAGIVAGAAWTVPLIQTATAPPAAASGAVAVGFGCGTDTDCVSGNCVGGYCAEPGKQWAGGPCSTADGCMSGRCLGGTCRPGFTGKACGTNADCFALNPLVTVSCSSGKVCGGTGASCGGIFGNAACVSNDCTNAGVCA